MASWVRGNRAFSLGGYRRGISRQNYFAIVAENPALGFDEDIGLGLGYRVTSGGNDWGIEGYQLHPPRFSSEGLLRIRRQSSPSNIDKFASVPMPTGISSDEGGSIDRGIRKFEQPATGIDNRGGLPTISSRSVPPWADRQELETERTPPSLVVLDGLSGDTSFRCFGRSGLLEDGLE